MGFFDFESKVDGKPLSEIYEEKTKLDKPKYKEVTNYNVCKCPNCGEIANVTLSKNANKIAGATTVGAVGASASTILTTTGCLTAFFKIITFGLIGAGAVFSMVIMPYLLLFLAIFFIVKAITKPVVKHTIECPHCHKKYEVTQAQLDELTL